MSEQKQRIEEDYIARTTPWRLGEVDELDYTDIVRADGVHVAWSVERPHAETVVYCVNAHASLTQERDALRAQVQTLDEKLAGQCETCAGTGVMQASADGGATYSDESCGECKGSGKGWMAKVVHALSAERDELRAALADAWLWSADEIMKMEAMAELRGESTAKLHARCDRIRALLAKAASHKEQHHDTE